MLKYLKWGLVGLLFTFFAPAAYVFTSVMWDKETNPLVRYLENQFHHPKRQFIQRAFARLPQANTATQVLVIGADIAEGDLILPLEKGYTLTCLDSRLMFYYDLIIPEPEKYRRKTKVLTKWAWTQLPEVDIVMASYILSFYHKGDFQHVWQHIDQKLQSGGYFIGNFFGGEWDVLPEKDRRRMSFFDKSEIMELFAAYDILEFIEVKREAIAVPGKVDHYYEVVARKRTSTLRN